MTIKQLKMLRTLPRELELLKKDRQEIQEKVDGYIVTDSVTGSNTEIPYQLHTITIGGITDTEGYIRAREELRLKEVEIRHTEQLIESLKHYIDEVPDPLVKRCLQLHCVKSKTWTEVAFLIGSCAESTVRSMVVRYLEKN